MIIYHNEDLVVDGSLDLLAIVFTSEQQRLKFIENLQAMPTKEGLRLYMEFPDTIQRKQVLKVRDKLIEEYGKGKEEA